MRKGLTSTILINDYLHLRYGSHRYIHHVKLLASGASPPSDLIGP